jgi:hypothetical protein
MRLLTTFILFTICLTAIGQTFPTKKVNWNRIDTLFAENGRRQKTQTNYSYHWIHTEVKFTDSTGKGVVIQNSYPKGGMGYTDPTGNQLNYVIFWTRIINETANSLELTINFPADSIAVLPSPYAHLFLPPDTMKVEKEELFDYGLTGLKSFLDTSRSKPTKLKRRFGPGRECLFYVGVLLKGGGSSNGPARAGLVTKKQKLFYSIRGLDPKLDSVLLPCGQIVFTN